MKAFIYTVYWTLITTVSCPPTVDDFGRESNSLVAIDCLAHMHKQKTFFDSKQAHDFVIRAQHEPGIENAKIDSSECNVIPLHSINLPTAELSPSFFDITKPRLTHIIDTL